MVASGVLPEKGIQLASLGRVVAPFALIHMDSVKGGDLLAQQAVR
jgi:hypothetical protein